MIKPNLSSLKIESRIPLKKTYKKLPSKESTYMKNLMVSLTSLLCVGALIQAMEIEMQTPGYQKGSLEEAASNINFSHLENFYSQYQGCSTQERYNFLMQTDINHCQQIANQTITNNAAVIQRQNRYKKVGRITLTLSMLTATTLGTGLFIFPNDNSALIVFGVGMIASMAGCMSGIVCWIPKTTFMDAEKIANLFQKFKDEKAQFERIKDQIKNSPEENV